MKKLDEALSIAKLARKQGKDPVPHPEIVPTKNLAERVEALLNVRGLADRIRDLEKTSSRDEIALTIASDFIGGSFLSTRDPARIAEYAIRVGLAILTEGVVAAPIEGISRVEISRNSDNSRYLKIFYTGPIRSAGGTAQALSVMIADFVRRKLGLAPYEPTRDEIERYVEEVVSYERIANLQYTPDAEEIRTIASNCPICIDGEATEQEEVEGYRNLPRVHTNRIRGGMVLVLAEGITLKASKLKKYVSSLEGWDWLSEIKRREDESKAAFLDDIVAGRPVFSHPSAKGGFRLRYGRSRNTGLATVGINPATMFCLGEFLAPGTQLKTEMPGKAAGIAPVDCIEGPTVRLSSGDVVRIDTVEEAMQLRDEISVIIDVGEVLINYGDFLENNYPLLPASYCIEQWKQENLQRTICVPTVKSSEDAIAVSAKLSVPLHPDYTYSWRDISMEDFKYLADYISNGKRLSSTLYLTYDDRAKNILERLLIPHKVRSNEIVIDDALVLLKCVLGNPSDTNDPLEAASEISGLIIQDKAPTRVGVRMGRPEKSKERKMRATPHGLFPVGEAGGRKRSLVDAVKYKDVEIEVGMRRCPRCEKETIEYKCECGESTDFVGVKRREMNFKSLLDDAARNLNLNKIEKLKGVQGLTSKNKTAEQIEKGVLRAKNAVYVFKDGTARYDLTNLPLTHFKPSEILTDEKKLRGLEYEFSSEDETVEIHPSDLILSEAAGDYLLKCSRFIDDLLTRYYKMDAYYRAKDKMDLIGHLVIGLAPHTSAGILGRIIGYTPVSACYAHPFFHAAKRRNCDGDEDAYILLLDGLINFSKTYLPDKTGGMMDVPLVLNIHINPNEIDSEGYNIDVTDTYPPDFYQSLGKDPKDIDSIITVGSRLKKADFNSFKFTHDTSNISLGPKMSAYKSLSSMTEKMQIQLDLANKIRAVDENDVAERVINTHFIPDLMGNLRAFSKQQVRCSRCNAKYRRPPLNGICEKCGSKLILTVHEGSVRKYLDASMEIANKYEISGYTRQRLKLIGTEVDSIFSTPDQKLSSFM